MCNANASERDLFKNFGEAFCAGFSDVAPAGYSEEADMQTDAPWCAPWEWADFDETNGFSIGSVPTKWAGNGPRRITTNWKACCKIFFHKITGQIVSGKNSKRG